MSQQENKLRAMSILLHEGKQCAEDLRNKINAELIEASSFRQNLVRFRLGRLFLMGYADFYTMMNKLVEQGLVEQEDLQKHTGDPDITHTTKRWYSINDKGQKTLDEQRQKMISLLDQLGLLGT